VPEIRRIFEEIRAEIERVETDGGSLAKTALEALPTNGGGKKVEEFFHSSAAIRERLQQIHDLGVQVKDVRRGLVDLPAWKDGEEVLLCWLVWEERSVEYWHDLVEGFGGRKPI